MRRAILLVAALAPAACGTTTAPAAPPGEPPILSAARAIMAAAGFCTLVTLDETGHPQARIMDPSAPDARMVVTLMTNPASRKVRQIERDPRVTLLWFDRESPGYVAILGRAVEIRDPAEKRRRWLDRWSPHLAGPEAAVLYEVIPERIEVVDPGRGVVGDDATWTPPAVEY